MSLNKETKPFHPLPSSLYFLIHFSPFIFLSSFPLSYSLYLPFFISSSLLSLPPFLHFLFLTLFTSLSLFPIPYSLFLPFFISYSVLSLPPFLYFFFLISLPPFLHFLFLTLFNSLSSFPLPYSLYFPFFFISFIPPLFSSSLSSFFLFFSYICLIPFGFSNVSPSLLFLLPSFHSSFLSFFFFFFSSSNLISLLYQAPSHFSHLSFFLSFVFSIFLSVPFFPILTLPL